MLFATAPNLQSYYYYYHYDYYYYDDYYYDHYYYFRETYRISALVVRIFSLVMNYGISVLIG
jgi:hypothetical protein